MIFSGQNVNSNVYFLLMKMLLNPDKITNDSENNNTWFLKVTALFFFVSFPIKHTPQQGGTLTVCTVTVITRRLHSD